MNTRPTISIRPLKRRTRYTYINNRNTRNNSHDTFPTWGIPDETLNASEWGQMSTAKTVNGKKR